MQVKHRYNASEWAAQVTRRLDEQRMWPLIDQYEAVRTQPGELRNKVTRELEAALRNHYAPVRRLGYIYRWSREADSIQRLTAVRPGVQHNVRIAAGTPRRPLVEAAEEEGET